MIAIVLPTYNERGNIEKLVKAIMRLRISDLRVIIVDDHSPDGTGELADELARKNKRIIVVHRKKKMGLGSAYKAGFKHAFEFKADVVVTMDADLSHNPKVIPELIKKTKSSDVVIGSRHTKGGKIVGFSLWRSLLSFGAQTLCRVLLGLSIHDSTSGFRAYRADSLERINPFSIKSEGYSFLIEAAFRIQKRGFKIAEVPIIFKTREKGKSKVSNAEIFKALLSVWRLKFIAPT